MNSRMIDQVAIGLHLIRRMSDGTEIPPFEMRVKGYPKALVILTAEILTTVGLIKRYSSGRYGSAFAPDVKPLPLARVNQAVREWYS